MTRRSADATRERIKAVADLTIAGWAFDGGRWTRPGAWATVTAGGIDTRGVTPEERAAFDVLHKQGTGGAS